MVFYSNEYICFVKFAQHSQESYHSTAPAGIFVDFDWYKNALMSEKVFFSKNIGTLFFKRSVAS